MAEYVTDEEDTSLAWLRTAEELRANAGADVEVEFFATLEVTDLGLDGVRPFHAVGRRIVDLGGSYHKFAYGDYRAEVTTGNRLWHICAGRNMIQDHAMNTGATHILFLDADMMPPPDAIARLLEMKYPIVGGEVPTYALSGPARHTFTVIPGRGTIDVRRHWKFPSEWDVREHMNTAGFLLVEREVFKRIRWRYSIDDGMTDDPCYNQDAREFLGYPTLVRHDVKGRHFPESILPIEQRYPNRNMKVKTW